MKRSKVSYGYIQNDTARKSSFKKRKSGLLKKVEELSILCGVQACGIVYSPNGEKPEFWPSELEVDQMLRHYGTISDADKTGKKMDEESYMKENVRKLEDQVNQLDFSNRDMENNNFLHQIYRAGKSFGEFTRNDLLTLKGYVEERRRFVRRRMQFMHQGSESVAEEETLIGDPSMEQWYVKMTSETQYEVGSSSAVRGGSNMVNRGHGDIGGTNYHTIEMYNGKLEDGSNGGLITSGSSGFSMSLYNWNNITVSSIAGNGVAGNGGAGHGWLLHHAPSGGQHHGHVGGTSAHGTPQFPGTNNLFCARLPLSNPMDVEHPNYDSSMPYYDNVGGNAGGKVAVKPEDHHK